jgi:hypothetical protein
VGLHQTKNFLPSKENDQQDDETTYETEENISMSQD